MHSVSVSNLGRVSQLDRLVNSSTAFHVAEDHVGRLTSPARPLISSEFGEVSLLPTGSGQAQHRAWRRASCDPRTERNESVDARADEIVIPNGKDRLKRPFGLLLKAPNTPEMKAFADEWCQVSAAADEQVMDRSAEGAAGGCDAV